MTPQEKNAGELWLLIAGAAIAITLTGRALSSITLPRVDQVLVPALTGVVLVAVPAASLLIARRIATGRALATRVRIAIVPADEFDPSLEAVLRFASQLARSRKGIRGWLDAPASAIRIRLGPDQDQKLVYMLELPARARHLISGAARALGPVELRDPTDHQPVSRLRAAGGRSTRRAELRLARPSVEPLARIDLDPDPLQPFAAALAEMQPGDRAAICIDLLPIPPSATRRATRQLLRQARPPHTTGRADSAGARRDGPRELAVKRANQLALDHKLKNPGPLFELQLLVRCQAADPRRTDVTMTRLLAGFDQLADRNWLRVHGTPIPGIAFLGSDLPWRRRRFDRRHDTGLFRPARRDIVGAREIAGLLKPPTLHCSGDQVLRAGVAMPTAPKLPAFSGQPELLPLGYQHGERGDRLVGVPVAESFFTYIAGRSRYGKTELAIAQFLHLVRSGHGGLFVDPHQDAVARIKPHLTDPEIRDRVVEINLASAQDLQPGWNLFDLTTAAGGLGVVEGRVDAVVDAFASALGWDERNNRALTLTTHTIRALATIAQALPPELAPTIFQLPTFLSDERWRAACLPLLDQPAQRFWTDRFPRLSDEAITPVTNLVDRLRASSQTAALLGQSQSTYRIRQAMDQGQIVLACPGSGGARDRLVANLLVFDLLHAAKTRATIAPERRRPFFVFLDEVQTYDGAAAGNLAALLEQTAKYGIRAVLLNQNPERLSPQTLNAITTNRSHLLVTALNHKAAALITKEWAGPPDPTAIARLDRFQFICQATHHQQTTKPFRLRGITAEDLHGPGQPDQLPELEHQIDQTAHRRPVTDAITELDTLDDRILAALTARTRVTKRGPDGGLAIPPGRRA